MKRSLISFRTTDPPKLSKEIVQTALWDIAAQLHPVEPKALAVMIDDLMGFYEIFGKKEDGNEAKLAKIYRETLGDLPEPLLAQAISDLKKTYKWAHRWPTPADIREKVQSQLDEMRHLCWKIEKELQKYDDHTESS